MSETAVAATLQALSSDDIDLIHNVLIRLEDEAAEINAAAITSAFSTVANERNQGGGRKDACLDLILALSRMESESSLYARFEAALQVAGIELTISAPSEGAYPSSATSNDDSLYAHAVQSDRRKLLSQSLDSWRYAVLIQRDAWLDQQDPALNQMADAVYRHNLLRRALTHWCHLNREKLQMKMIAESFRGCRDATFGLKMVTLVYREVVLRRVRDERLIYKSLGVITGRAHGVQILEMMADEVAHRRAIKTALGRMMSKRRQTGENESKAAPFYESHVLRRTSDRWAQKVRTVQRDEARADAAVDYFALNKGVSKWRAAARIRREERKARTAREQFLFLKYFRKWQTAVKDIKSQRYGMAYKAMRKKVKMNVARAALHVWRNQIQHIGEMSTTAADFRILMAEENAKRMAHDALTAIFQKTMAIKEKKEEADLLCRVHLIRRVYVFDSDSGWHAQTLDILASQKKADDYRESRIESMAVGTIRKMGHQTFRTQRLGEEAEAFRGRRDKREMKGLLDTWRRKTAGHRGDTTGQENLPPVTPAARRTQLLASTTPAYTPVLSLGGRLEDMNDDEETVQSRESSLPTRL